jgi:2-oxoglutarate ferredoxin oxidoreductase subunit alpha
MGELIGLAYYAEIPLVIVDVQRVGPSTGMPTRTQQGDLLACAYASHGDTKHICLFPANPEECFRFAALAFDLAERFQTPVFMLSDLDIGMNDWVCKRLTWDDSYRPERGRVLDAAAVTALGRPFTRYWPVDEDFVAARTLPGQSELGAYFARGSGHNQLGGYTEAPREYQQVVDRLAKKHHAAARAVPAAVVDGAGARTGLITIGGCDGAVREALATLRARGMEIDLLRVRGFPFGADVEGFIAAHERCFVVEQNRDGQLRTLLTAELGVDPARLVPVLAYGGFPLCAREVVEKLEAA